VDRFCSFSVIASLKRQNASKRLKQWVLLETLTVDSREFFRQAPEFVGIRLCSITPQEMKETNFCLCGIYEGGQIPTGEQSDMV
jgi:hypothetical protein